MNAQSPASTSGQAKQFAGLKSRRKIHWLQRKRSAETSASFNALCPVGTRVIYHGVETWTECPAACNANWEPAVFVHGIEEPVELLHLEIPGIVFTRRR